MKDIILIAAWVVAFVVLVGWSVAGTRHLIFNSEPRQVYAVWYDGQYMGTYHTWYTHALQFETEGGKSVSFYRVPQDTTISDIKDTPQGDLALPYPNPCDGVFNIWSSDYGQISLYDPSGRFVCGTQLKPGINAIELPGPAGVYFWQMAGRNGKVVKL